MIKQLALITISLILFQSINAQEEETSYNEVITFHPFYLVNSGIRIDYDRKIAGNHWIQICPQFYAAEQNENNDYRGYNELMGVGVSLYHRIYLGNKAPSLGTYFSYGATFSHFNMKYDEPTSSRTNATSETNINKFGGDIVIGYQLKAFERLIIDVYGGLGGRYADKKFTGPTQKEFNRYLYDYGYTGNVILGGVRIGFSF